MKTFEIIKSVIKYFLLRSWIVLYIDLISHLTFQQSFLIGNRKFIILIRHDSYLRNVFFFFKRIILHCESWAYFEVFFRSEFGFENLIFLRSRVILMFIFHCNFTHVYFFLLVNILQNTRIVAFSTIFSDFNIQAI